MKILQLIFSLSSGGAERFTVDISNELSKDNEVFLCTILSDNIGDNSFFKNQINENVEYINLASDKGFSINSFFKILRLIIRIKPEIIHFHLNTILYLYIPSLIFGKRIKFIHTLHSVAEKTIGFKWQKKVNKYFYENNLIQPIAISKESELSYVNFYKSENIEIIENGVRKFKKTPLFKYVKDEINGMKLHDNSKVFIHIGSYLEPKNQNLLIDVFNRLLNEDKDIILIIIGKLFDTGEAIKLKQRSDKGIYFLGTRENISDYLLNSDLFVLSSLWEGLPISLLEAMSCGVIPVCTPAGGIPDVIKDETVGYLSKDFTEEGLYNAIVLSLKNIDQFNSKNLINYFNSNFSIEECSLNYEKIYIKK